MQNMKLHKLLCVLFLVLEQVFAKQIKGLSSEQNGISYELGNFRCRRVQYNKSSLSNDGILFHPKSKIRVEVQPLDNIILLGTSLCIKDIEVNISNSSIRCEQGIYEILFQTVKLDNKLEFKNTGNDTIIIFEIKFITKKRLHSQALEKVDLAQLQQHKTKSCKFSQPYKMTSSKYKTDSFKKFMVDTKRAKRTVNINDITKEKISSNQMTSSEQKMVQGKQETLSLAETGTKWLTLQGYLRRDSYNATLVSGRKVSNRDKRSERLPNDHTVLTSSFLDGSSAVNSQNPYFMSIVGGLRKSFVLESDELLETIRATMDELTTSCSLVEGSEQRCFQNTIRNDLLELYTVLRQLTFMDFGKRSKFISLVSVILSDLEKAEKEFHAKFEECKTKRSRYMRKREQLLECFISQGTDLDRHDHQCFDPNDLDTDRNATTKIIYKECSAEIKDKLPLLWIKEVYEMAKYKETIYKEFRNLIGYDHTYLTDRIMSDYQDSRTVRIFRDYCDLSELLPSFNQLIQHFYCVASVIAGSVQTNSSSLAIETNVLIVQKDSEIILLRRNITKAPPGKVGDTGKDGGNVYLKASKIIGMNLVIKSHGSDGGTGGEGLRGLDGTKGSDGSFPKEISELSFYENKTESELNLISTRHNQPVYIDLGIGSEWEEITVQTYNRVFEYTSSNAQAGENGGPGGKGYRGGDGGSPGSLYLRVPDESAHRVKFEATGGKGGEGGRGGNGGRGGEGGLIKASKWRYTREVKSIEKWKMILFVPFKEHGFTSTKGKLEFIEEFPVDKASNGQNGPTGPKGDSGNKNSNLPKNPEFPYEKSSNLNEILTLLSHIGDTSTGSGCKISFFNKVESNTQRYISIYKLLGNYLAEIKGLYLNKTLSEILHAEQGLEKSLIDHSNYELIAIKAELEHEIMESEIKSKNLENSLKSFSYNELTRHLTEAAHHLITQIQTKSDVHTELRIMSFLSPMAAVFGMLLSLFIAIPIIAPSVGHLTLAPSFSLITKAVEQPSIENLKTTSDAILTALQRSIGNETNEEQCAAKNIDNILENLGQEFKSLYLEKLFAFSRDLRDLISISDGKKIESNVCSKILKTNLIKRVIINITRIVESFPAADKTNDFKIYLLEIAVRIKAKLYEAENLLNLVKEREFVDSLIQAIAPIIDTSMDSINNDKVAYLDRKTAQKSKALLLTGEKIYNNLCCFAKAVCHIQQDDNLLKNLPQIVTTSVPDSLTHALEKIRTQLYSSTGMQRGNIQLILDKQDYESEFKRLSYFDNSEFTLVTKFNSKYWVVDIQAKLAGNGIEDIDYSVSIHQQGLTLSNILISSLLPIITYETRYDKHLKEWQHEKTEHKIVYPFPYKLDIEVKTYRSNSSNKDAIDMRNLEQIILDFTVLYQK
ncbi:uncharacterized protein LOC136031254 [Artemia franciscana]|uniref:uncharacterized protein LOC136031254 n=1 Tax=Artemia franciscana TaxID=6661 RepID=UPI0032DAD69D